MNAESTLNVRHVLARSWRWHEVCRIARDGTRSDETRASRARARAGREAASTRTRSLVLSVQSAGGRHLWFAVGVHHRHRLDDHVARDRTDLWFLGQLAT